MEVNQILLEAINRRNAMMKKHEWEHMGHGYRQCPECQANEGYGHDPGCEWNALIRGADK